jgi:cell division transport system permease protein
MNNNNWKSKKTKSQIRTATFSTIISIALVLFTLGILGLILINAEKLSRYVKENIGFHIYLQEEAKETEILRLQKTLDAEPYVRETKRITKEEAAEELKKTLGEDFIEFLGYNPLSELIEIKLKYEYANPDSLSKIEEELYKIAIVKEVDYQKDLITLLNENIKKISIILLIISGLLLLVAIALINNTIRLNIYSKRLLIRSMQLIGAKPSFIRRPFLLKGLLHGFLGALLAVALIVGLLYVLSEEFPLLVKLIDYQSLIILFILLILLGIMITWISTYFAVRKFLRMRTSELF